MRNEIRHVVGVVACAALVLFAAAPAQAWAPLNSCRPTWASLPSPYHVNDAGYSRIPLGEVRAIFAAAMNEWKRPCCSDWSAADQGLTSSAGESRTFENIFSFRESSWPNELGDPNATLAVTLTTWGVSREGDCDSLTADMVFNAANHTYATSHSSTNIDLLSVTTHEAGHWLGLSHSTVDAATMWPSYTGEDARYLHADDEAGVCALYPGNCTCSTTADCDPGEVCDFGQCEIPPCGSDADCAVGLVCSATSGDCVVPPCGSDADCLGFETCVGGVCEVESDCPTCAPCNTVDDCGTAGWICAGTGGGAGVCTRTCSDSGDCPGNSDCYDVGEILVCLNDDADTRGACPADYVCVDDSAPDPCETVTCPTGQVCDDGTCFTVGGADGCVVCDACEVTADCGGGDADCYSFDGVSSVCALTCASTADCPANTACLSFQSGTDTFDLCLNADFQTRGACPADFECRADLCAGVVCAGGATCNAETGVCEGSADAGTPDTSADAGQTPDAAQVDAAEAECAVCSACNTDAECGDGSYCQALGAAGRVCTFACQTDAECPGNTACFDVAVDGESLSLCVNADAASGGICNATFQCIGGGGSGTGTGGGTGEDVGVTPFFGAPQEGCGGCASGQTDTPAAPLALLFGFASLLCLRRRH